MKTKKEHYVDNAKLYEALVVHKEAVKHAKETGAPRPQVSNYIAECLIKISTRVSYGRFFLKYEFKDDMIYDGIENCLKYIDNFNPKKTKNPFSYFTTIIIYAFYRKIYKEKKQLYTKFKAIGHFNTLEHNSERQSHDTDTDFNDDMVGSEQSEEYMNTFIKKFEESQEFKMEKRKKAKAAKDAAEEAEE